MYLSEDLLNLIGLVAADVDAGDADDAGADLDSGVDGGADGGTVDVAAAAAGGDRSPPRT